MRYSRLIFIFNFVKKIILKITKYEIDGRTVKVRSIFGLSADFVNNVGIIEITKYKIINWFCGRLISFIDIMSPKIKRIPSIGLSAGLPGKLCLPFISPVKLNINKFFLRLSAIDINLEENGTFCDIMETSDILRSGLKRK